jgi:CheY-like chemotaxis protein
MSLVHPGTILVLDDDCGHAILITKALRRAHITNPITTLHDGQDAVDLCCATGQSTGGGLPLPLLMILDLRLPGLNGLHVLQRMQSRGTDPVSPCHPRQRRGDPGRPRRMPGPRVYSLSHRARAGCAVARRNTTAGTRRVDRQSPIREECENLEYTP